MLAERVKTRVRNLISSLGLLSPDDLAACLGLTVIRVPLKSVRGLVLGSFLVGINAEMPLSWQHGVILHECGHRVLNPGENRFFLERATFQLPGRREMEANLFALFYLLEWDRQGFERMGNNLFRFAAEYGLPQQAAETILRAVRTCFWEAVS